MMRTEVGAALGVAQHATTQQRSPVRPLATTGPIRVPFFLRVRVPVSESSSRCSTSPVRYWYRSSTPTPGTEVAVGAVVVAEVALAVDTPEVRGAVNIRQVRVQRRPSDADDQRVAVAHHRDLHAALPAAHYLVSAQRRAIPRLGGGRQQRAVLGDHVAVLRHRAEGQGRQLRRGATVCAVLFRGRSAGVTIASAAGAFWPARRGERADVCHAFAAAGRCSRGARLTRIN